MDNKWSLLFFEVGATSDFHDFSCFLHPLRNVLGSSWFILVPILLFDRFFTCEIHVSFLVQTVQGRGSISRSAGLHAKFASRWRLGPVDRPGGLRMGKPDIWGSTPLVSELGLPSGYQRWQREMEIFQWTPPLIFSIAMFDYQSVWETSGKFRRPLRIKCLVRCSEFPFQRDMIPQPCANFANCEWFVKILKHFSQMVQNPYDVS